MALFSTIGNIIGSNSQRKASDRIVDASQETNTENNALARENRDLFFDRSDPFVSGGLQAFNTTNALLGLGGSSQPAPQNALAPQYGATNGFTPGDQHMGFNGATYGDMSRAGLRDMYPQSGALASYNPRGTQDGIPMANAPSQFWSGQQPPQGGVAQTTAQPTGQSAQDAANDAFDIFRNSTNYQFRVDQANDQFNSNAAAGSWLQSGAALQERDLMNQNFASNELNNYMNRLGSQTSAGMSALGAQAGVGTNYTGQVSQNNNNALGVYGNAQLTRAANNPWANALSGIGASAQQVAGFALGGGF